MKNTSIRFLTTGEFKKEVETVAESDNKTMTGYITDLILDDFKKRGLRDGAAKKNEKNKKR